MDLSFWRGGGGGSSKDSKRGFGCDLKNSLLCGNRVPYRSKNADRPAHKPFFATVSSQIGDILNP